MMATWRWAIVLLVAFVAPQSPSYAVPPALCRQTMVGVFKADDGRAMPVALRLRMRSDDNDLSFRGRFRCTAKREPSRCFIGAAIVDAFGLDADSAGGRLAQSTSQFVLTQRDPHRVLCELTATTPLVRDLCVPALGGRFACRADGELGSVSGAFGLAVDSCKPCLFD